MNQEILQILEFPDFHITYKELQSDGFYKIISKLKKVYKNNPEYKAPSEIDYIQLMSDIRKWESEIECKYIPHKYHIKMWAEKLKKVFNGKK